MFFHQIRMEPIVTRRNRSMCRENHLPRHAAHRFVEANTFIVHPVSNRFEHGKCAVPFIQMEDAGSDSQGFQRAEASDAEKELLPNTDASIAAIESGSQVPIL